MSKKNKHARSSNIHNVKEVRDETASIIKNGLGDAIGYPGSASFGSMGVKLSQVDTLFNNNRWYLLSNMRQLLSEMYVEHGLVQNAVDIPVDDAFRGGCTFTSKQLNEEQLLLLQSTMDREDDFGTAAQACKWNRLFGGAGILIMTNQDPATPLNVDAITKDSPLEFRAVDMWELFWDKQNSEGYDPAIQTQEFELYNYYGKKIHKSRVLRLKGLIAPSFIRHRLRGWGLSIVETLVRSINQYLKSHDLTFEVLDEFKLDIFKMKNLNTTLLSPQGEAQVRKRVNMANWCKNYNNALIMDSEDDYDHKQLSFTGLAEVMTGIRVHVASDLKMPLTKLFGVSAAGFNSGEDDIEVYNGMVEGTVRNKIKYDVLRLAEIRCQYLFGIIPDDLEATWKPLRVLSAVQEEEVKDKKFQRVLQARQAAEISAKEFRDACNKEKLLPITLDTDLDMLNPHDPNFVDEGEHDPKDTEDVAEPGANKTDSRKPRAWDTDTLTDKSEPKSELKTTHEMDIDRAKAKEGPKDVTAPKEEDPARHKAIRNDEDVDGEEIANPGKVDETLWEKAKEASQKAFGKIKWPFVTWFYKEHGGTFNKSE